jgi:hypothetical protein
MTCFPVGARLNRNQAGVFSSLSYAKRGATDSGNVRGSDALDRKLLCHLSREMAGCSTRQACLMALSFKSPMPSKHQYRIFLKKLDW